MSLSVFWHIQDIFHGVIEAPQDISPDYVIWRNHLKEGSQSKRTGSYKKNTKDKTI
jgi:hypothetical protein